MSVLAMWNGIMSFGNISCMKPVCRRKPSRFLMARQLNVEKALEMLQNVLTWRQQNGPLGSRVYGCHFQDHQFFGNPKKDFTILEFSGKRERERAKTKKPVSRGLSLEVGLYW